MINLIIDIDRTIADQSERASVLQSNCNQCGALSPDNNQCLYCSSDLLTFTDESFEKFIDPTMMSTDRPIYEAQRVITTALKNPKLYSVHYITGRKDVEHRAVTKQWLQDHFNFNEKVSTLSMRTPNEIGMRASDCKEINFNKLKKNLEGVFIFFEDDPFVQTMYSKYGMVVRCPDGWASFMPKGLNRLMERQFSQ